MLLLLLSVGLSGAAQAGETIKCQEGMEIALDNAIYSEPLGNVKAQIKNIPLMLHDYVTITRTAPFSMLAIKAESAYCSFHFLVDYANSAYIFKAHSSCEGQTTDLKCEVN